MYWNYQQVLDFRSCVIFFKINESVPAVLPLETEAEFQQEANEQNGHDLEAGKMLSRLYYAKSVRM